jgi:hypothetical protein
LTRNGKPNPGKPFPALVIEDVWGEAMKSIPPLRIRCWSLIAILLCAVGSNMPAEPVPVRHAEGTIHGFLELRSEEGHVIASGDLIRVARGDQVTTHTLFHFNDGSIDDETTVFSQRRNIQLITDHHIQKGPSFPHPIDMLIDRRSGQVTVRSFEKDGKEEVRTDHLDLPPDLANGIVPLVIENIPPGSPETTVSMLVATPKPRIVKLVVQSRGEEPFSVVGSSHEAIHYEIKIDIGGVAGVVAPLVGKQPPDIQAWVVGGQAPTLIRERGPIYPEGPIMTIELASPVWQDSAKSGD